jgi:hypothetical protein
MARQHRILSKKMKSSKECDTDPLPRLQFLLDLQSWISHKILEGHEIILAIDANEDSMGKLGWNCPLQYTLDKPTSCKEHDGSLATMMVSCGLSDPLLMQHAHGTPPPTHSRDASRIDYILVSNLAL